MEIDIYIGHDSCQFCGVPLKAGYFPKMILFPDLVTLSFGFDAG